MVSMGSVPAKGRTDVKASAVRRFIPTVDLLLGAVVLTVSAALSASFAVRDGQPSEHWIFTAMTVVSALALGGAAVFSENRWIRRSSIAALCLIGALGAIANYLLLEPSAALDSALSDVVRYLMFGATALAGPATTHLVSMVYRANIDSTDQNGSDISEASSVR